MERSTWPRQSHDDDVPDLYTLPHLYTPHNIWSYYDPDLIPQDGESSFARANILVPPTFPGLLPEVDSHPRFRYSTARRHAPSARTINDNPDSVAQSSPILGTRAPNSSGHQDQSLTDPWGQYSDLGDVASQRPSSPTVSRSAYCPSPVSFDQRQSTNSGALIEQSMWNMRAYQCSWMGCGSTETFHNAAGLVYHLQRVHIGSFHPTQCRWMGCHSLNTWFRPSQLMRHLKLIHIEPDLFQCAEPGCSMTFGRYDHLAVHRRGRHAG